MEAPERPSRFHRFLGAPFLAAVLGAGALLWGVGLVALLYEAGMIDREREPLILGGCLAAVLLSMRSGYLTPVQSYVALVGRLLGVLFFGFVLAVGSVAVVESSGHARGVRTPTIALVGVLFTALAVARLYGRRIAEALRADPAARWKAGVAAAVLALGTAWCGSADLRCRLGDGASCRAAGEAADEDGDGRRAATLFERGCGHGDAGSCRLLASRVRRSDPLFAEDLLRDGCLLGDPEACGQVHALRLEQGCDRYRASACRQLAEAYASGDEVRRDPSASSRLFHKACLLGDEDACRR